MSRWTTVLVMLGGAVAILAACFYGLMYSNDGARFVLEHEGVKATPNALTEAVRADDVWRVKLLLRSGVAPDSVDGTGETPLVAAVRSGRLNAARVLMDSGAELDRGDAQGLPAMSHALLLENWVLARELASAGASVDVELAPGRPALVEAAVSGHEEMIRFLMEYGADVNRADHQGLTPLALAVERRDFALADRLLERGATPDVSNLGGDPAVLVAARLGEHEILTLLADHGADLDPENSGRVSPLAIAVQRNDRIMADFLIERGVVPDENGEGHYPLLLAALERDNAGMARMLAESGVDLGGADPNGRTAFGFALENGDDKMINFLLDSGAPYEQYIWKMLKSGNRRYIDAVLELDVNFETPDENGETPMAAAVRTGDFETVEMLLGVNASVKAKCRDGQPQLAWAIAHRRPDLVRKLIEAGAEVDERLASPMSNEFRGKFSLSSKLSYYLLKDSGLTSLMLAAGSGQKEIVQVLLENDASIGVYTRRHKTYPIQFAAYLGDTGIMQLLLGRKAGDKTRQVVIDLSQQRAWLYEYGKLSVSTNVSTGKSGYTTPVGEYVITNKYVDWTSTIYHAKMPYFMRLSCGNFGLHEGVVPSYPASHGCIRVPSGTARKLFSILKVGDLVSINR